MSKHRLHMRRKRYSLSFMHSRAGSEMFKELTPGEQNHWAAFDRRRSRLQMLKMMKKAEKKEKI